MNVAPQLAYRRGERVGIREMPTPMPLATAQAVTPEVLSSGALSLFARPGDGTIRARRIAILIADGCEAEALLTLADRLLAEGAVPTLVSIRLWDGPIDFRRDPRGGRQPGSDAIRPVRRRRYPERENRRSHVCNRMGERSSS